MKRAIFLVAALMCCFLVFAGAAFAGYFVSGGVVQEANGLYCETDEMYYDRPVYRKSGTSWEIFFVTLIPDGGDPSWWIDDNREVLSDSEYFHSVDHPSYTPPIGKWTRAPTKVGEAPTLSFQSCDSEAVPTMNQWGFIIFGILLAGSAVWFIRKRKQTN